MGEADTAGGAVAVATGVGVAAAGVGDRVGAVVGVAVGVGVGADLEPHPVIRVVAVVIRTSVVTIFFKGIPPRFQYASFLVGSFHHNNRKASEIPNS